jgi:hypothetical protein
MLPANIALHRFASPAPSRKIGFAWKKKGLRKGDIALVTEELARLMPR